MRTLLSDVVDRMLRLQPVTADNADSAQQQVNIRVASVREGFQTMRARSDEMSLRLRQYRGQRAASFGKKEPARAEKNQSPEIVMRQPSSKI